MYRFKAGDSSSRLHQEVRCNACQFPQGEGEITRGKATCEGATCLPAAKIVTTASGPYMHLDPRFFGTPLPLILWGVPLNLK